MSDRPDEVLRIRPRQFGGRSRRLPRRGNRAGAGDRTPAVRARGPALERRDEGGREAERRKEIRAKEEGRRKGRVDLRRCGCALWKQLTLPKIFEFVVKPGGWVHAEARRF